MSKIICICYHSTHFLVPFPFLIRDLKLGNKMYGNTPHYIICFVNVVKRLLHGGKLFIIMQCYLKYNKCIINPILSFVMHLFMKRYLSMFYKVNN